MSEKKRIQFDGIAEIMENLFAYQYTILPEGRKGKFLQHVVTMNI